MYVFGSRHDVAAAVGTELRVSGWLRIDQPQPNRPRDQPVIDRDRVWTPCAPRTVRWRRTVDANLAPGWALPNHRSDRTSINIGWLTNRP